MDKNIQKILKIFYLLLFVILIIPVSVTSVFAQEGISEESSELKQPVEYKIGIALANIGKIDRESGSYELTFWTTIVTDESVDLTKNPPGEFDYTNGNIIRISGQNLEPHFYKEKVQGVFFNDIDFRNYPFEEINLAIHIETFFPVTADDVIFTINQEYMAPELYETVSVPGWEILNPTAETYIDSAPWADFPHAKIVFPVTTDPNGTFVKKIFPIIIITIFGVATFWMTPRRDGDRLQILAAVLAATVFYHVGFFLAELPPIGYSTMADKIMIASYSLYIYSLVVVIFHRHNIDKLKDDYTTEISGRKDKIFKLMIPVVVFGVFGLMQLF